MNLSEEQQAKLSVLLFQLSELIKDPPTPLDLREWTINIDDVMKEIEKLSEEVYEQLVDLIAELVTRGEVHVEDLDNEAAPGVIAGSSAHYFEQVAFTISEINRLKSF